MGEGVSQFDAEALVSDPRVDVPQAAHKAPGLGCQVVLLLAHSLCTLALRQKTIAMDVFKYLSPPKP